jgi:hypothetical protein
LKERTTFQKLTDMWNLFWKVEIRFTITKLKFLKFFF